VKAKAKRRSAPKLVNSALVQLTRAELLRRLEEAELAYLFKHALVQETVYATLLKNENRRLHRLVAHALENVNAQRLDEYAAQLAQHYDEAEDDAKTLEYSTRAGDIAARVFANEEALIHYTRAIEVAKRIHAPSPQIIHLYRERGRILEVTGKYFDAVATYEDLYTLAKTRQDRSLELAYLMQRAPLHSSPMPTFDAGLAKQLLLDALGMARELEDETAEARVLWNLCLLSVHTMRPGDGLMYGELALQLTEKLNLHDLHAYTLHDLFIPYRACGQIQRARDVQAQARALFREMDNKAMLADNLGMSAQFAMFEGELERAVEFGTEGLAVSRAVGNPFGIYFNQSFLANVYLERGEFAQALETVGEQIQLIERGSLSLNALWLTTVLAWFFAYLGAFAKSEQMERLSRSPKWETIPPIFRRGVYGYRARLRLLRGDLETAAADLEQVSDATDLQGALELGAIHMPLAQAELALAEKKFARVLDVLEPQVVWSETNEYHLVIPENLYLQARAHMGLGELDTAAATLERALDLAHSMNARRIEWQILAARSELERMRGNSTQAEGYRAQARAVLEYIVTRTPKEYRETFSNLPNVREVLA
jgi:tetratricopeptide (TPR) repeat protein